MVIDIKKVEKWISSLQIDLFYHALLFLIRTSSPPPRLLILTRLSPPPPLTFI